MTKIVWMMSISLDGFIEGPNREIDWHRVDDELHAHFNARLGAMAGFLDGRVSYELMAQFWPTADRDPSSPPVVAEFARIWRDMPKVVYSRTLSTAQWNTRVVHDVTPQDVATLKAQASGDLVLGGANLGATFLRLGLIDECWIYVHPVVIGGGTPMFPRDIRADLRLLETQSFGNGVVRLRYDVLH